MKLPDFLVLILVFRPIGQSHGKSNVTVKIEKEEKLILQNPWLYSSPQLDVRIRELSPVFLDMVVCEALTYQMMLQVLFRTLN